VLRRILCISSILALVPSIAFSGMDLALKLGAGLKHYDNRLEYSRYRILLGLEAGAKLYEQQYILVKLKGDGEFSYGWYDYKNMENISTWGVAALFDIFPEMALNLSRIVQPCLGAGLTFGLESTRYTEKGIRQYDYSGLFVGTYDMKSTYRDQIYGFMVQPSLKLLAEQAFARGAVKYRYLLDRVHYEWKWDSQKYTSGNEDYSGQSIDIVFSVGVNLGYYMLEAGLQAENWVFKHEDSKEWPPWPEDWEYMLFGRIHFGH